MIGISSDDLADFGITATNGEGDVLDDVITHPKAAIPTPLVRGSVAARALYSVLSGTPATLIDAPPGSGKTEVIVTMIAHMVMTQKAQIVVATPTREQAVAIANRLTRQVPAERVAIKMRGVDPLTLVKGVVISDMVERPSDGWVQVRTLASLAMSRGDAAADAILFIDEAYQSEFLTAAQAAESFEQVVLVGDPGQIGPVTTINTEPWESMLSAPHRRAPEVFGRSYGCVKLAVDTTWRLGPDTAALIAPIYPFRFTSVRPETALVGVGGRVIPEIVTITRPIAPSPTDEELMQAVVDRVSGLIGSVRSKAGEDDLEIEQPHIAVVAALNAQVIKLTAMLSARGLGAVKVGTADKLQGGEWPCVVALDPMSGAQEISTHHLSLGRLCVLLSRHSSHLSWVTDGSWRTLAGSADSPAHARIRKHLDKFKG